MEIPKEIVGRNKIRDTRICLEYISGKDPKEIVTYKWVTISVRRIYNILFRNQDFINPRIAWPKSRRIWMLQQMIDNAEDSKKDKADLLEQMRKEVEGDKPIIENHTHLTIVGNLHKIAEEYEGNRRETSLTVVE